MYMVAPGPKNANQEPRSKIHQTAKLKHVAKRNKLALLLIFHNISVAKSNEVSAVGIWEYSKSAIGI